MGHYKALNYIHGRRQREVLVQSIWQHGQFGGQGNEEAMDLIRQWEVTSSLSVEVVIWRA